MPRLLPTACLIGFLALSTSAHAGGVVELNLVGDSKASALAFQDWVQALGKAGIHNVRIRSGNENDKPSIETQGTADSPLYVVTGIITSRNEILVPGARFGRGDISRLATWLKDLAENGPAAGRAVKSPSGLVAADFTKIRQDLAPSVSFDTLDMTPQQAVEKIAGQLKFPLKLDDRVAQALGNEKLADDLSSLSRGTALACILRPAGYCLMPRASGGETSYLVVKSDGKTPDLKLDSIDLASLTSWPVGWGSTKSDRDSVPGLYEFYNVNVKNTPAATVLEAIGKRVKIPIVYDRKALTQQKIDPTKTLVTLKNTRTFYASALRRLLFQARLKCEVRYDDSGSPFLWVTTGKRVD